MSGPARILVIDDEHSVRWAFERALQKAGYQPFLAENGLKGLAMYEAHRPDLVLVDIRMPEMDGLQVLKRIRQIAPNAKVIVMTAYSDMETTVTAMKLGAYDFLTKPFDIDACLNLIQKGLQAGIQELVNPEKPVPQKTGILIGNSPCMQEVYKLIGKVSAEDVTVLITGESGTGKEIVAQAIHYNSNRHQKPFWAVNCTAVTESLMESELFGYEKGAFTGANTSKPGVFEVAQGGTLFLDEIGDMSMEMQAQLLRVLEEREVVRVGGNKRIKVDVRLITATNKDLRKFIQESRFREDLYHRIKVIELHLPPLRDRKEDIPVLATNFLALLTTQRKGPVKSFAESSLKTLSGYHWPGNVRELRNAIDTAYTLSRDLIILPEHLPAEIRGAPGIGTMPSFSPGIIAPASPGMLPWPEKPVATSPSPVGLPGTAAAISPSEKPTENLVGGAGRTKNLAELVKTFVRSQLSEELNGNAYEFIMDQLEKELLLQALALYKGNQVQTAMYLGITRNTLRAKIQKYQL
jgi:DNA-binding NtrC family response regulator